MEATIDLEILQGINEQVVQKFLFRPPYVMESHGSNEKGFNWADGFIPYDQVQTVLSEAVAPYDHLYARGYAKCELLSDILN